MLQDSPGTPTGQNTMCWPVPSPRTVARHWPWPFWVTNAITPFGPHQGLTCRPSPVVSCRGEPPCRLTTYRCAPLYLSFVSRAPISNTTEEPPGDHEGLAMSTP